MTPFWSITRMSRSATCSGAASPSCSASEGRTQHFGQRGQQYYQHEVEMVLTGASFAPAPLDSSTTTAPISNPVVGNFRTSDGRWINLNMLQPGRYFADVCKHLGVEHLLDDERFTTGEGLLPIQKRRERPWLTLLPTSPSRTGSRI